MSKKKADTEIVLDKVDEALRKEYGNVFFSAQSIIDKPKTIIPLGATFDLMLGGGIPEGSSVVVTGPPKVGKSTFCLHFAAKAQKLGFMVYYFNVEGRLKSRDLLGIPGLDLALNKFEAICSDKGNILSAEKYLDILIKRIEAKEKCLFILDSISQLCSDGRHAANIGDRFRDDVPLMLASLTKRVANVLPVNDNILVSITHKIANQGQGHSPWMEASGQKVQYQADVKLRATHKTDYAVADKQVGQIVHWECDTSALGPPGGKCSSLLRYGQGIDEYYDLVSMASDIGIITKGGAWYTIGEEKVQGIEKAAQYLRDNPQIYENIGKEFLEAFK